MFKYQPSIRQKITIGYYAIVAIIVFLSVLTLMELRFLEKKIVFGDVISEFFDATLEMRRFEKNYFLYRGKGDYAETITYADRAIELLEINVSGLSTVAQPLEIRGLKTDLVHYKRLMARYVDLDARDAEQKAQLEGDIRRTAKEITTAAETIARTERSYLQKILLNSQNMLIFSLIFISVLVIGIGQVLTRIVLRPLKLLEKSMKIIAEGKFDTIQIDSKDREIVSLTGAFTAMLKELELRQRHLIQSEKLASLGTLLSGVAHELNNPLSNISSSCQILAEEIRDDDMVYKIELLAQIDEQTDRARNIVRSLLEFSREKGFKKESMVLKKLVEETIRFVKGQMPTKVEILIDIPADITLFADKQRIQQAFLNLIKNAVEAIPEGGGLVAIGAHIHTAEEKKKEGLMEIYNYMKYSGRCDILEDAVDIQIRDTGAGISKNVLPKIFDPFFTTKDVGRGSGLGLFIVHEIIEEHDGCIAVDSDEGKGTTFLIRLPLRASYSERKELQPDSAKI